VTILVQVPEPSTIILIGLGLLTVVAIAWVRARRPARRPPEKGL